MSRSSLYAVIAILSVIVVGFGLYLIYQQTQEPRLEIRLDEQGLTVDGNG